VASDNVNDPGVTYKLYNPTLELCDSRFVTTGGTVLATTPGDLYSIKTIGSTTWMTENLAYTGITGTPIGKLQGKTDAVGDVTVPAAKPATPTQANSVLYTWNEASVACPADWRLPTDAEWLAIEGTDTAPLKAASGWPVGSNGLDDFGFGAVPRGKGTFDDDKAANSKYSWTNATTRAYWWSGTSVNGSVAKYKVLSYDYHTFQEPVTDTQTGITSYVDGQGNKATVLTSVRCVKATP
jgi:uncharacterized protein (TIGR02145 family)